MVRFQTHAICQFAPSTVLREIKNHSLAQAKKYDLS